jgi:lysophospholipase L1-like esterase
MRRSWARGLAVLIVAGVAAGGTLVDAPEAAQAAAGKASSSPTYYVSLGDSYSVGYQPGLGSTPGYTAYVAKQTDFTLANFGCGGATTTSILQQVGCPALAAAKQGVETYPTSTQAAAAEAFLTAHAGHIGVITVSIGGNDVTACASQPSPVTCVASVMPIIKANVTTLATALRAVAGPGVPIIGLTYPDVILGEYVYPSVPPTAARVSLAKLSVVAFKSLINPTLQMAYAQGEGALVDVTKATGAYGPLTKMVTLKPYGKIPVPVAKVCTLTWFCAQGNIHARTGGYALIGKLIVSTYHGLKGKKQNS